MTSSDTERYVFPFIFHVSMVTKVFDSLTVNALLPNYMTLLLL